MIAAVPLIVNEVEILPRSRSLNRISASLRFDSDTPTLPISGLRHRMRRVEAALGRQVQRDRQAGLALVQQELVALVGFLGGAEARVLADGPQPALVAVGEDAARERVLARLADALRVHRARVHAGGHRDAGAAHGPEHGFGRQGTGVGVSRVHCYALDSSFSEAAQWSSCNQVWTRWACSTRRCACQPAPWRAAMACALMPRSTCGAQAFRGFRKAATSAPRGPSAIETSAQAPGHGLLGGDQFAAAHHAQRARRPDEPEQVRPAAPGGGDGQLGLDVADARMGGLHAHVAGQRQFGAAADGVAVHIGDDRHRAVADGIERRAGLFHHGHDGRFVAHVRQVAQVTAGREVLVAGAGHHDVPDIRARAGGAHRCREFRQHRAGQRVVFGGAVDRDPDRPRLVFFRPHGGGRLLGT